MNLLYMGSSEYSLQILKNISKNFSIALVVTQPDKPAGRGKKTEPAIVKIGAEALSIPVIQPKKLNEDLLWKSLEYYAIDMILVAAYGKILPKKLLELPKLGCINVHASLLPRWRGASPIQAAILNGDQRTGVTLMKMDEGIDTGSILSQRLLEIDLKETSDSLQIKLAKLGSELLNDTLPDIFTGKIKPQRQNDNGATYAGLIKKTDGLLEFFLSSEYLERKIRAFYPWPICYMEFDGTLLRVYKAEVSKEKHLKTAVRGIENNHPSVGTATNDLILLEVQPSGKKRMDGKSFLNGARNWIT